VFEIIAKQIATAGFFNPPGDALSGVPFNTESIGFKNTGRIFNDSGFEGGNTFVRSDGTRHGGLNEEVFFLTGLKSQRHQNGGGHGGGIDSRRQGVAVIFIQHLNSAIDEFFVVLVVFDLQAGNVGHSGGAWVDDTIAQGKIRPVSGH